MVMKRIALDGCFRCGGTGELGRRRPILDGATKTCSCVLRHIFRECFNRYLYCRDVRVECCVERIRSGGGYVAGFKTVEYMADFQNVGLRTLAESSVETSVFRFHFLFGADWKLCCRKLGMDRGEFFHAVYRVEDRLGWAFCNLKPYALWPVREYFTGQRMYLREMDLQHTSAHPTGTRRFFYATAA